MQFHSIPCSPLIWFHSPALLLLSFFLSLNCKLNFFIKLLKIIWPIIWPSIHLWTYWNKDSMRHDIQSSFCVPVDLLRSSHCCDVCLGPHTNPSTKHWVRQSLDKEHKSILFFMVFCFSEEGEKRCIEKKKRRKETPMIPSCTSNFYSLYISKWENTLSLVIFMSIHGLINLEISHKLLKFHLSSLMPSLWNNCISRKLLLLYKVNYKLLTLISPNKNVLNNQH